MHTAPSSLTHRPISSAASNFLLNGRQFRPVRLSITSNPEPLTYPCNSPFSNTVARAANASGKALPVRAARTFRTRAPQSPVPVTRGWIVATPLGTMNAVLIGLPGRTPADAYVQATTSSWASRRTAFSRRCAGIRSRTSPPRPCAAPRSRRASSPASRRPFRATMRCSRPSSTFQRPRHALPASHRAAQLLRQVCSWPCRARCHCAATSTT